MVVPPPGPVLYGDRPADRPHQSGRGHESNKTEGEGGQNWAGLHYHMLELIQDQR